MKFSAAFLKLQSRVTPAEVQALLNQHSLYKVYTTLGISDQLLIRYIKHHNLSYKKTYRTMKDLSAKQKEDILADWCGTCATKREIGKKYNIGAKVLTRFFKENNVSDRKSAEIDPELVEYQKLVRRLTSVVKRCYNLNAIDGYEWDHKFSVIEGYRQKVHPNIIASRENLELIPVSDNRGNGHKCSITCAELLNLVGYS